MFLLGWRLRGNIVWKKFNMHTGCTQPRFFLLFATYTVTVFTSYTITVAYYFQN